ncbi:acetyl-CoA acetyltransferase [Acidovorax sp. SRB_14]|uniref:acetyl-CoA acetyltransferase n=1 Tax=Acidovorax sp. SRB_14 TaxID=1962699 RepID=UPI0020B15CAF|nr:acetyl-CoA acetyltransferase [Acidovorax sp. SRB_14]
MDMTQATYVLGGYQTDFAKAWSRQGQDLSDIVRETVLGALQACQIAPGAIESIHVGNAFGELQRQQAHLGSMVAQVVPALNGVAAMRHEGACASSSLGVLSAMAEIESGRYDCVLVLGVEEFKNTSGHEASRNQNAASWQGHEEIDCQFMWPAAFGLVAAEYDKRYGLDRKYLNRIAELNYGHAKHNPLAQTRSWQFNELSFTDDDEANPLIEPGTRRQDCGQVTDGGAAVVLASERFAKEYAARAGQRLEDLARITGWGHRNSVLRLKDKFELSKGEAYVFPHVRQTLEDAWRRAGIGGIGDLSGIETHDCFTTTEYVAIDHFGFTEPGQSWQAVEDGSIERGGRCPINMSGGLIGGGHPVGATGVRMVLDCARQVTGKAGATQIPNARRMQTLNIGGSFGTVVSFVVEQGQKDRER